MDELITPAELDAALSGGSPPLLIDVRSEEAYRAGHIPGARHIPSDEIEKSLDQIQRDRPVVTY